MLPHPEESPTVPIWPDACHALGIGRAAGYAAAERGEIPVIRLGRSLRVPTAALRRLLELDDDPQPVA